MGSHRITCHPIQANPHYLIYGKRARPPHITAVTFLAVKPVPICTAWWAEAHVCEQLAQGRYLAVPRLRIEPATSGLQVRHVTVRQASHTELKLPLTAALTTITIKVSVQYFAVNLEDAYKTSFRSRNHNGRNHWCSFLLKITKK